MTNNIYQVFQRINDIKDKFGLNPVKEQSVPKKPEAKKIFSNEIENRISEQNVNNSNKINNVNNVNIEKAVVNKPVNRKATIAEINNIVRSYSKKVGVPESLIKAVIKAESGYNQFAVSRKGARGLMQLMPPLIRKFNIKNPFDPAENIRGGVLHLKRLLNKYKGDYGKSLAAYNAGETAVDKRNGIPNYRETKGYVRKVRDNYLINIGLPKP